MGGERGWGLYPHEETDEDKTKKALGKVGDMAKYGGMAAEGIQSGSYVNSILGGAGAGATAGSIFGAPGAAIGGVAGGIAGGFAKAANKEKDVLDPDVRKKLQLQNESLELQNQQTTMDRDWLTKLRYRMRYG